MRFLVLVIIFSLPLVAYPFIYNPLYLSDLKWQVSSLFLIPLATYLTMVHFDNDLSACRIKKTFYLFLSVSLLAALFSANREISLRSFLHYYCMFGAFCSGFYLFDKEDLELVSDCLMTSALVCIVGLFMYYGMDSFFSLVPLRGPVFFGNKIFFTAFMTFVLPLAFMQIFTADTRRRFFFSVCIFAALFFTILKMSVRSYWIISLMILSVDLMVLFKARTVKKKILFCMLIVCLVMIGFYFFADPAMMITRIRTLFDRGDVSFMTRFLLLKTGRDIFFSNFLLGIGPGMFQFIQPIFLHAHMDPLELGHQFNVARIGMSEALAASVHNDFLQIALCTGIFGFCAFAFLLVQMLRCVFQAYAYETDPFQRIRQFALCSSVLTVVIGGFFNSTLHHPVVGVLCFFSLGLLCHNRRQRGKNDRLQVIHLCVTSLIFLLLLLVYVSDVIANIYIEKGYRASRQAQSVMALKAYRRAQLLKPYDYRIYVNKGNIAFNEGDYPAALSDYLSARERNPYSANILNSIAVTHAGLGEAEQAEEYFKQAILYGPCFVGAYRNYGIFLYKRQNYGDAIEMLEKAAILSTDDSLVKQYLTILNEKKRRSSTLS
jgi:tetratricopeptide (TPR) repeat protein